MNNTITDKHEPLTIVQILDIRQTAMLQLTQKILRTLSFIATEEMPSLKACILPDVGCAVLTVTAKPLMSAGMRCSIQHSTWQMPLISGWEECVGFAYPWCLRKCSFRFPVRRNAHEDR